MKINKVLTEATQKIKEYKQEETVAKILLAYTLSVPLNKLYTMIDETISNKNYQRFLKYLDLYLKKEKPVQYITGIQNFYGYDFKVNKNVLIPRPETEELIEHVLFYINEVFGKKYLEILDLGTGSGCIGITLDKKRKNSKVTATDISSKALKVAKENNQLLESNVTFIQSDLFNNLKGKRFDVIVSNPPYIPENEWIGYTVKHEPKKALYGGIDGLDFYRKIIKEVPNYLNKKSILAFEHAYNKSDEIKEMIVKIMPDARIIQHQDLSKKDRITVVIVGE